MTKYAATTKVSVEKTKQEIERILTRFGATKFMTSVDREKNEAQIMFNAQSRWVRLTIGLPEYGTTGAEQEERRRWRSLGALLKAKLVAVDDGISEFEQEFYGDVVLSNGETVYERTRQATQIEYESGKPKLLADGR